MKNPEFKSYPGISNKDQLERIKEGRDSLNDAVYQEFMHKYLQKFHKDKLHVIMTSKPRGIGRSYFYTQWEKDNKKNE